MLDAEGNSDNGNNLVNVCLVRESENDVMMKILAINPTLKLLSPCEPLTHSATACSSPGKSHSNAGFLIEDVCSELKKANERRHLQKIK